MSLQGSLDARGHPRLDLRVSGPYGSERVSAVIDTGFTGVLSLSDTFVRRLGLLRRGSQATILADGSLRIVSAFLAEIDWIAGTVTGEVLESTSPDATIGAGLLRGSRLEIDYGVARSVEVL